MAYEHAWELCPRKILLQSHQPVSVNSGHIFFHAQIMMVFTSYGQHRKGTAPQLPLPEVPRASFQDAPQKCSPGHSCHLWGLLWLPPLLWLWGAPLCFSSQDEDENLILHSTAKTRLLFGTKFSERLKDKRRWNINSGTELLPEGALPRASGSPKRAAPLLSCRSASMSVRPAYSYTRRCSRHCCAPGASPNTRF